MAFHGCNLPLSSDSDLTTFITTGQASCWKMKMKWTREALGHTRSWSPVVAGTGSSWASSCFLHMKGVYCTHEGLTEGGRHDSVAAQSLGLAGWCCPSRTRDRGDYGPNTDAVPDEEQTSSRLILKNTKTDSNLGGRSC